MYSRSSRIASSGGEMSRLGRYGVVNCASLGVIVLLCVRSTCLSHLEDTWDRRRSSQTCVVRQLAENGGRCKSHDFLIVFTCIVLSYCIYVIK